MTERDEGLCLCGCGQRAPVAKQSSARRGHVKGQPIRYANGHNGRKPVEYVEEGRGYDTPCWIWQKSIDACGYGKRWTGGASHFAHRYYYERAKGPVPEGMQLDHLCRTRACVNPAHLEVVTGAENSQRGLNAKITADDVAEIRRLRSAGVLRVEVAKRYHLCPRHVSRITQGCVWRSAACA